eukprot:NODE_99_length_1551_cov_67.039281_g73_i0.p1 GENE.NODE_99_length_1551_cov_67.039281_g73_i0~~NODE_99_length_1551_cov_67.039281_g73_i0.p1  ORF type:complete len:450 (-),score=94.22 NODE_99_length_1551_cov_67.039281_g73_i0:82-1431(-)
MPKREEDPSLVGIVISFDPVEEERREQEEEEQRRLAKKLRKLKKDDSSKCSGATASTSKSEKSNGNNSAPVPDKIVTTIILEVEEETTSNEGGEARPTKEDETSDKKEKKQRSKEMKKAKSERNMRKCKSERNLSKSSKKDLMKKSTSVRELKKSKSKKDLKKDLKKEEKRQRRAARTIQRIARGYLVRQEMERTREEESRDISNVVERASEAEEAESSSPKSPSPRKQRRLGARIRRAMQPRPKDAAASRVQNAFRLFHIRKLFKEGDKQRWRMAWQRFFVFAVLAPLERMRQKQRLMQGPALICGPQEDVSDSTDRDDDEIENALFRQTILSPVRKQKEEAIIPAAAAAADNLLDVIPEDKTHCEQVDHLLDPLPSFADSDGSSVGSLELMADMVSVPQSPSTVTTAFTAGSLSPRRCMNSKPSLGKNVSFSSAMHSSCPVLRFDCV